MRQVGETTRRIRQVRYVRLRHIKRDGTPGCSTANSGASSVGPNQRVTATRSVGPRLSMVSRVWTVSLLVRPSTKGRMQPGLLGGVDRRVPELVTSSDGTQPVRAAAERHARSARAGAWSS